MDSDGPPGLLGKIEESRQAFLAVVQDIRPDLHRYCARMTGSVVDGEDVVQDVLARAFFELSTLKEMPPLRAWLFRIAHNRAIDFTRRHERRLSEPLDPELEIATSALDPEASLAQGESLEVALATFLELAPAQRSCVILKDVLGHSVEEIVALLGTTEPAVSSALHRGRARLRELARRSQPEGPRRISPTVARYAALFNTRDWEGVRALLVDDVKLDLVSQWRREGRRDVSAYFTNYERMPDVRLIPGWLSDRPVLAVYRGAGTTQPSYFIEVTVAGDRVTAIRDFRYVPYIGREADFRAATASR
jgi:RNA polymerase sigma factor (sigma-70 family)